MHTKEIIGMVGLGYVGLPAAVGFAKEFQVIGYDTNEDKIRQLQRSHDPSGQVATEHLRESSITFTTNEEMLKKCKFIIVAVPTPITVDKHPDLTLIEAASETIGNNLSKGTYVIYESTVFPGATEEFCIPILEKCSGLKAGMDFHVGYSPERINPGDEEHTFSTTPKIVAAQSKETTSVVAALYEKVIHADIFKAASIKTAEAAKLTENIQRDINIALMNELSLLFEKLDINTHDVLNAAQTKWNFIPFYPGLVGGHCIGVDPYYLIHQGERMGYSPDFLKAARAVNESMTNHIVETVLQFIKEQQWKSSNVRITILGITFKEDVEDMRNSKALEIANSLQDLGLSIQVCDPYASADNQELEFRGMEELDKGDIVILAVPHQIFERDAFQFLNTLFKQEDSILMDLKGIVPKEDFKGRTIWTL